MGGNRDWDANLSLFFITTQPYTEGDLRHVLFGRVTRASMKLVKWMEVWGNDYDGKPARSSRSRTAASSTRTQQSRAGRWGRQPRSPRSPRRARRSTWLAASFNSCVDALSRRTPRE